MSRKTSKFARKRRTGAQIAVSPGACMQAIIKSTPFHESGDGAASMALLKTREAFRKICAGDEPPESNISFDVLAHVCGVSRIRALEIGGIHNNPMLEIFDAAEAAINRCRHHRDSQGVWGFDDQAICQVEHALEVYETIVLSSSPNQMIKASNLRESILRKQLLAKKTANRQ